MPGMEQPQPCLNVTPMAILMGQITQIATLVGTLMPVTWVTITPQSCTILFTRKYFLTGDEPF